MLYVYIYVIFAVEITWYNNLLNFILCQAALHVWKTIVANTPKTLKEIMPVLMNTLISSLASLSSERRQVFTHVHIFSILLSENYV